jgi:aspartate aminotransferase-like enzyme
VTIPVKSVADPRLSQGRWLRIPGPTVVHPDAAIAQSRDMIPHRGPEMTTFMGELREKAATVHRTSGRVLFWAGSGSSGWEAGITNLLSPGDTVVATISGAFGERFAQVGTLYGLDVRRVEVEWGKAVKPDQWAEALDTAGDNIKAVFITHNETSTGVTNPLRELAALARAKGALVLVDAVSSAAAMPVDVDEWDLDWTFSGVQKAWMCPPGLMVAAVSDRAMEASKSAGFTRFFFDLAPMAKAADEGSTATTPSISLLYALDAAIDAMHAEGLEAVWARHQRLGSTFRAGLAELGIEVLAEAGYESSSITAFRTPNGIKSDELQRRISDATGIVIATGQGPTGRSYNRVGHMGFAEQPELDATLEAIGAAMQS